MAEVVANLRWYLELDGVTEGIFREVTGLDSETEVVEHRHSGKGGNIIVNKIPGALKFPNITLKRGVTNEMNLHNWRKDIEQGKLTRKNGSVTLYAPNGDVVAKYSFVKAWPCKLQGPSLDATKNDLAVESLELCHEGMTRQQ